LATLTDSLSRRDIAVSALKRAAQIEPTGDMIEIAVNALSMFQVRELSVAIPGGEGQVNIAINLPMARYAWFGGEQSRMEIRSFLGHDVIRAFSWQTPMFWDFVEWLPDGVRILARRRNGPLELWNLQSGAVEWSHAVTEVEYGSQGHFIGVIAADPSGGRIAHIEPGSKVEILDTSEGRQISVLETQSPPSSLAFHPREPWIAIGTGNGVEIFDWREKRRVFQRSKGQKCTGVTWSADGQVLAHSGWSYLLELWVPTGDQRAEAPGLGGYFTPPRFSDDGRWLAVCNEQGVLTLRSGQSGDSIIHNLSGYPIAFQTDGSRLYRRTGDSGVSAYELSESECYTELEVPFYADSSLPGLAISSNERWVAATSYSSGVYVWDLENPGFHVRAPMFGVSSAMFNDSGTQLLTCLDQGIQIWDFAETANGRELKGPRLLESRVGSSRVLTHTFASDRAVIVSSDQAVWKFSRGNFLNPVKLPSRFEQSAAISPHGRLLAESSYYAPLDLSDLEKNQTLQNLAPPRG
jgi:WD40 repeat protein